MTSSPKPKATRARSAKHRTAIDEHDGLEALAAIDEDDVEEMLGRLRVRAAALARFEAEQQPPLVLPRIGWTLEDSLAERPEEIPFTIAGLHATGCNTLLIAQYKTGKTTFCGNLVRALVNREPFLDHFDTHFESGKIAYFNYEMQSSQLDRWLDDIGVDASRVVPPASERPWIAGLLGPQRAGPARPLASGQRGPCHRPRLR